YIDLVNHYNALSYDSPAFANLVFWRCQQLCHVKYRCALWGEHQQVLNSLRIVLNQLREFQAAKAYKQSNESYVNEAHGFNVSGTGGYREINVELASMLEKCNRAYECPTVKMNLMKDQYERRLTDLNSECTSLQNISQRDLKKTKEQVSVTVQELFSLTFLNL
ncbi:unnamed protein product, partial [Schistosoma haematobium]